MFDAQEFMALAIVAIVAACVVWRQWLGPLLRPASRARKASGSCSGCASARPQTRRAPQAGPSGKQ